MAAASSTRGCQGTKPSEHMRALVHIQVEACVRLCNLSPVTQQVNDGNEVVCVVVVVVCVCVCVCV